MPLVCKSLQRERRKKMKDMKLWEKRIGKKSAAPEAEGEPVAAKAKPAAAKSTRTRKK